MKNESNTSAPKIRIIKVGTCPTLSGKGTLEYHISCSPDGEIFFRVFKNSGSGFFSSEWISMNRIQEVSNTILPLDKPVSSFLLLSPVYLGRSQNSPGFGLAILLQEGLVVPVEGDERVYYRTDGAEFYAAVKGLIDSDIDIKIEEKSKKPASSKPEVSLKKVASKSPKKNPVKSL